MKEGSGGNTILTTSLALNVALVGIIFWLGVHNSRILMKSYVEAARDRMNIQQSVLTALESGDPQKIEDIKSRLRLGVDVDQRVAYKLETGERPSPRGSNE
ncbi:MAG: hypothetical protein V1929_08990 [bacterium]